MLPVHAIFQGFCWELVKLVFPTRSLRVPQFQVCVRFRASGLFQPPDPDQAPSLRPDDMFIHVF